MCVCVDAISDVHVCACVLCVFIDSLLIRMEIFNNAEHNSTLNRVLLLGSADGRRVWWWHVYRARACVCGHCVINKSIDVGTAVLARVHIYLIRMTLAWHTTRHSEREIQCASIIAIAAETARNCEPSCVINALSDLCAALPGRNDDQWCARVHTHTH